VLDQGALHLKVDVLVAQCALDRGIDVFIAQCAIEQVVDVFAAALGPPDDPERALVL
jgi:hypothetical protein